MTIPADLEKLAVPLQTRPEESLPGLICVLSDESARYSRFAISMLGLQFPVGTRPTWMIGNDIAESRNIAMKAVLDNPQLHWVWFIDDDHAFDPFIILKLLSTRKQVVGPLCLRRQQPFRTTATDMTGDFLKLDGQPASDLIEVLQTGSSGLLIRRQVIEQLAPQDGVWGPWFELAYDMDGNRISEDINFCHSVRARCDCGIYVHTGVRLGHITTAVVWPGQDEGRWITAFEIGDGATVKIQPAA
jgi:hypothetical protein